MMWNYFQCDNSYVEEHHRNLNVLSYNQSGDVSPLSRRGGSTTSESVSVDALC